MSNEAIIIYNPQEAVERSRTRSQIMGTMATQVMKLNIHFGAIGTGKPTLLKAGAEMLCTAFDFVPRFKALSIVEDFERGLFFYRYECELYDKHTGLLVATGIGSCNSMETKYRFRWVKEDELPLYNLSPQNFKAHEIKNATIGEWGFAITKAETSGKYGKPKEYWQRFNEAIANGTAIRSQKDTSRGKSDFWEIPSVLYRIDNPDIFEQVNTFDKMAQKRALVAAVLIGANASEFYTQDLEDMPSLGGNWETETIVETTKETKAQDAPQSHENAPISNQGTKPSADELPLNIPYSLSDGATISPIKKATGHKPQDIVDNLNKLVEMGQMLRLATMDYVIDIYRKTFVEVTL